MEEQYRICFYADKDGRSPFEAFLNGANEKVRAKFIKLLTLLESQGPNLKRPYADVLRDGIRELRVALGHGQYRALYFFAIGKKIIVTHGIVKKTDKVPNNEIDRAIRYRKDYEQRTENGEIDEEGPPRQFQRAQEEGS